MDAFVIILLCVAVLLLVAFAPKTKKAPTGGVPKFDFQKLVDTKMEAIKESGQTPVLIQNFVETYKNLIPEDLFADLLNKQIAGEKFAFIENSVYQQILSAHLEQLKIEAHNELSSPQNN